MKAWRLILIVALLAGAVASCGGDSEIEVSDVWARTSAQSQENGAVYMTITGGAESDRLIGVSVSQDVARMAMVHETTMDSDGVMMMQAVEGIDVDADGEVVLAPGGYHVMLMQLTEPLVTGEQLELTLTFEEAGEVDVTAEVRDG